MELLDTHESEHKVGRKCDVNNTHLYFPSLRYIYISSTNSNFNFYFNFYLLAEIIQKL